jgi:hypothetical protein
MHTRTLQASVAFVVGLAACAASPSPPASALAPTTKPAMDPLPAATTDAPTPQPAATAPQPSPAPEGSTVTPTMAVETITGIPTCDAYLDLYARCESYLRPQIMAGDRRFYAAEKASLLFFADSPDAAKLPQSCTAMLHALLRDCPEPQRTAGVTARTGARSE